jgi:hypothetical protein
MLPKEERRAMLLRLFNDNTPLVHMKRADADKELEGPRRNDRNSSSEDEADAKVEKMLVDNADADANGAANGAGVSKAQDEDGKAETEGEILDTVAVPMEAANGEAA